MKNIFKNIKLIHIFNIIIIGVFLFLLVHTYILDSNRIANEAKIDLMKQEEAKLKAKINKKSEIELLELYASESKKSANDYIKQIEEAKTLITKLEPMYEEALLRVRCNEEQISRKIAGLEYNINYCKDNTVLNQFRTVK